MKGMVYNMDTKINQLTNKMCKYDQKKTKNSQYGENNNKNNWGNSKNTTNKNKGGGGSIGSIYSGNNYSGGSTTYLQVDPCTISYVLLVCVNEYHWINHYQRGYVPRLITPEGQGTTTSTNPTGIFYILRKCKQRYKTGQITTLLIHMDPRPIDHSRREGTSR